MVGNLWTIGKSLALFYMTNQEFHGFNDLQEEDYEDEERTDNNAASIPFVLKSALKVYLTAVLVCDSGVDGGDLYLDMSMK